MTITPFPCTGRIEIYPFPTETLSDHQFLSGNKTGVPVLIAGELRQPAGDGPFPAVVLVHGSGGVGGSVDRWAVELNHFGVAVFILDCFSGRGIRSTIPDQSRLGSLAMIFDTYRALELLLAQPSIDANHIALMGFSKGGFATLYASMKRFQGYFAPAGAEFAAYLPFYPRCDIDFFQDEDVAERPIRIFHGEADDWVPVEPVRRYVARLQAAGKDVSLTTYPGARHAFDSTTYPPMFTFSDAEISSHCRLVEKDAQIINLDTGKPFTNRDACVTRGASVGSDSGAYQKAHADVKKFLSGLFHLA
jgi:dienelactone hydrolase